LELLESNHAYKKPKRGNLANKNLARVYGKVKSKLNASAFLRPE
jgi:hypothetical protein